MLVCSKISHFKNRFMWRDVQAICEYFIYTTDWGSILPQVFPTTLPLFSGARSYSYSLCSCVCVCGCWNCDNSVSSPACVSNGILCGLANFFRDAAKNNNVLKLYSMKGYFPGKIKLQLFWVYTRVPQLLKCVYKQTKCLFTPSSAVWSHHESLWYSPPESCALILSYPSDFHFYFWKRDRLEVEIGPKMICAYYEWYT